MGPSSRSKSLTSRVIVGGLVAAFVGLGSPRAAEALAWKGHTWNVTSGGMAGVCQGDPANVFVDADGFLHLRITNKAGTWTAAELFTTDKIGFGTYQWQVDGPIDQFDANVVLGLFPYGPAANIGADGTNEIDIEYSRWGHPEGPNLDWTDYPASGKTIGEQTNTFSLNGGTSSTSRFVWSGASIESSLLSGFAPVGSAAGLIKSWTYAPSNPTTNIPQKALPLGMNLWCFDHTPSDDKDVEVIIRDFQVVAPGASAGGSGGGAGAGGSGGGAGAHGSAGGGGSGATTGAAGQTGAAGTMGGAGTTGTAGIVGGTGGAGASGEAGSTGGTGAAGEMSATSTGGASGAMAASGAPAASGATGAAGAGADSGHPPGVTTGAGCGCSLARQDVGASALWLAALGLVVSGRRRRGARGA